MKKTAKRIILGITIPAAIAGAIVAGLLIYRNTSVKPVPVYALEELAMTDMDSDATMTSGSVSSEGIQKVFLSGSQSVSAVNVEEGQSVKKGDVLITYDTTLTQIDIERAEAGVGRLKLQLSQAEKELEDLNNAQPHTVTIIEPGYTVEYTPSKTPLLLRGSGSSEDPYIYLFDEFDSIDGSLLKKLLADAHTADTPDMGGGEAEDPEEAEGEEMPDETDAGEISDETDTGEMSDETDAGEMSAANEGSVYVVVINRENNAMNAQITEKHGLRIDVSDGEIKGLGFFEPYIPDDIESYEEQPESYEEESGSEYTAEELARMRAQKAAEIQEMRRSVALAQNEYERKKLEADESTVRASTDGVVTKVRSAQEAQSGNEAVVELSAGGAYYVTGTVNEFDREKIKTGDHVSVEAYGMDGSGGGTYEGEIVEISDKPASGEDAFSYFSYGDQNSNVSYYPFKVRLPQEASLRDDAYVDISYRADSDSEGGVYIMNAFIRRDGGGSYVYAKGEDGLLEKRSVTTGRSLWGSYTRIKGGLKPDDKLAFPYGKDVREGAKTAAGNPEDLYGDMPMW